MISSIRVELGFTPMRGLVTQSYPQSNRSQLYDTEDNRNPIAIAHPLKESMCAGGDFLTEGSAGQSFAWKLHPRATLYS